MTDNKLENINFKLTDKLWEDMAVLEGIAIASLVVWDSSLIDDSLDAPASDDSRVFVDFELYLANQTLLELYGAAVLRDEDSEALIGLDTIGAALSRLAQAGAVVQEVAADQDDGLVLTLASDNEQSVLVPVSAWLETTWDTLPEESI